MTEALNLSFLPTIHHILHFDNLVVSYLRSVSRHTAELLSVDKGGASISGEALIDFSGAVPQASN